MLCCVNFGVNRDHLACFSGWVAQGDRLSSGLFWVYLPARGISVNLVRGFPYGMSSVPSLLFG